MNKIKIISACLVLVGCFGLSHSVDAYTLTGHVWGVTSIPYYVNPENIYVTSAEAISSVQSAANDWNNQGGVKTKLTYAGTSNGSSLVNDGKNNIFFRNDSSGYVAETYWWWDGTGKIVDADIVYHENYKWYADGGTCPGDGFFIQNTGTHEFGHLLGLGHSDVSTATMWPTTDWCQTARNILDPDDIAGIQSIYPGSSSTYSHIGLSTNTLSFSSPTGIAPASQIINITNTGNATLNWNVSSNQTWCNVSPLLGSAAVNGTSQIIVSVSAQSFGSNLNCTIAVSSSGADNSPQYINLNYVVIGEADTVPPTVSISSPINGAKVSGTVALSATASDASGISKVEFYTDGKLLASDISSPYTAKWNINGKGITLGNHTISVKAFDKAGNVGTNQINVIK